MQAIISKLKEVYWFFEKRVANVFYSSPFLFILYILLIFFFKIEFIHFFLAFLVSILFLNPKINFFSNLFKRLTFPNTTNFSVSIIVIFLLSLVAKPNINTQRMTPQSYAKIELVALYKAQVESKTKYGTYATCIEDLGYEPPSIGRYIIGFQHSNPIANKHVIAKGKKCSDRSFVVPTKLLNEEFNKLPLPKDVFAKVDKNYFTAIAVGYIGKGPGYKLDIWSIDEHKHLTNVQDGTQRKSLEPQPFLSYSCSYLLEIWNSIRR